MASLRIGVVALAAVVVLGGCVAAECRDGSHKEGNDCVPNAAGEGGAGGTGGDAGVGGTGGTGGDAATGGTAGGGGMGGTAGDDDGGTELDAGADARADAATDADPGIDVHVPMMCNVGYSLDVAGACVDDDECQSNPCGDNATCVNTPGTFECSCISGYLGDGITCVDVNECDTNNGGCDALTTCTNTPGTRICGACPSGYAGNGDEGCMDIDECTSDTDDCDSNPVAICSNTPGAFTCACPSGYEGDGHGSSGCVDINECASGNGGCDTSPMVTCTNTEGGRTCGPCPSGYTGNGIGANGCQDINECATSNGGCDAAATCMNTPGSRTCSACPAGYTGNGAVVDGCVPRLASLAATPGLSENFSAAVPTYSLSASSWLTYVEVIPTTNVAGATIRVGGSALDAQARAFFSVGTSANASIPVTVTDAFGRVGNYTIEMTRRVSAPAQTAYIKSANTAESNQYTFFGMRVAMSGNTLVASRNTFGNYGGVVEVYVRNSDTWTHQATLDPLVFDPARLSNGFGRTGLDIDGDVIVVGDVSYPASDGDLAGGVHVFRRTGTSWARETTLTPGTFSSADDNFGWSVAVSGNVLVVGIPGDDSATYQPSNNSATDAGAARVYERVGGAWTEGAFLKATVARPGSNPDYELYPRAGDSFGAAVDVVGDTIVVGAPNEDSAATGVNQAYALSSPNSGAVYTFVKLAPAPADWYWQSYIKPAASVAAGIVFGASVSMATEQSMAIGSGIGAYVFHAATPGAWSERRLLDDASSDSDGFGAEVRMWSPGMVVVGAPLEDSSITTVGGTPNNDAADSGAAYLFTSNTADWAATPASVLIKTRNAEAGDSYSSGDTFLRVAMVGDVVITTAPREDSSATGIQYPGPTAADDIDVNINWNGGAVYSFR